MIEHHLGKLLHDVLKIPDHEVRERGHVLRHWNIFPESGPSRKPLKYTPEMAAIMLISIASGSKYKNSNLSIRLFNARCTSDLKHEDVTFGKVMTGLILGTIENSCGEIWVHQFGSVGKIYELDDYGWENPHCFESTEEHDLNKYNPAGFNRFGILYGSLFDVLSKLEWRSA